MKKKEQSSNQNEVYFFPQRPLDWGKPAHALLDSLYAHGGVLVRGEVPNHDGYEWFQYAWVSGVSEDVTLLRCIPSHDSRQVNELQLIAKRNKLYVFELIDKPEEEKTEEYGDLFIKKTKVLITLDGRVFADKDEYKEIEKQTNLLKKINPLGRPRKKQ